MIFVLLRACSAVEVVYGSSLQLKSVYTKHRVGVTTSGDPMVFASRPPYNEGWMWTIEPDKENASLARRPVLCGSNIALFSTISEVYMAVNAGAVVARPSNEGPSSHWLVTCEAGTTWDDSVEISLMNVDGQCFLSTELDGAEGRFNVTCGALQKGSIWKAAEGIYFSGEIPRKNSEQTSDEL